jgi:hypothetical protein
MSNAKAAAVQVTLHLVGSAPRVVAVDSIEAASRVVTECQDEAGVGASGCAKHHGEVKVGGVLAARVSYNGRIFAVS